MKNGEKHYICIYYYWVLQWIYNKLYFPRWGLYTPWAWRINNVKIQNTRLQIWYVLGLLLWKTILEWVELVKVERILKLDILIWTFVSKLLFTTQIQKKKINAFRKKYIYIYLFFAVTGLTTKPRVWVDESEPPGVWRPSEGYVREASIALSWAALSLISTTTNQMLDSCPTQKSVLISGFVCFLPMKHDHSCCTMRYLQHINTCLSLILLFCWTKFACLVERTHLLAGISPLWFTSHRMMKSYFVFPLFCPPPVPWGPPGLALSLENTICRGRMFNLLLLFMLLLLLFLVGVRPLSETRGLLLSGVTRGKLPCRCISSACGSEDDGSRRTKERLRLSGCVQWTDSLMPVHRRLSASHCWAFYPGKIK